MTTTCQVATELRDGLLQDLLAVGLLVGALRQTEACRDPRTGRLLERASAALDADVMRLRAMISQLGPPA